ncbi:hypothetical protein F7Q99_38685 [Streptomyces kaniharaensis]|uniref:Uncharacterized protein n=1 Tax=Streptomyces kaniharaensis TaxID=212423 RepID=A0A6N7L2W8_9ACTN|nr:hypothetical protein [Streptomyces kaniharaensis]MQS17961.1 hypothetical protein [Streptomyces kaniharaensis]
MSYHNGEHAVHEFERHPRDGERVLDAATGWVGIIDGQEVLRSTWSDKVVDRRVWLIPPGGGHQWPADPGQLSPAPDAT